MNITSTHKTIIIIILIIILFCLSTYKIEQFTDTSLPWKLSNGIFSMWSPYWFTSNDTTNYPVIPGVSMYNGKCINDSEPVIV